MMVKVYSKNGCIQCKMTKRWLDGHNIPFESINVEEDQKAIDRLNASGFQRLPVTELTSGRMFTGFDLNELKSLI